MYLVSTDQLAAQHVTDLRCQAEHERLVRTVRAGRGRNGRRRVARARWGFRLARPARA